MGEQRPSWWVVAGWWFGQWAGELVGEFVNNGLSGWRVDLWASGCGLPD